LPPAFTSKLTAPTRSTPFSQQSSALGPTCSKESARALRSQRPAPYRTTQCPRIDPRQETAKTGHNIAITHERPLAFFWTVGPSIYRSASVDVLIAQLLNALLYAAVLFLIAGGLSLIFGVMRIINMAHGSFYALGAYVMAWLLGHAAGASGLQPPYLIVLLPVAAVAIGLVGAVIEPLLRPLYARAEEYQLLLTFGLLLIFEDVMRYLWGPTPLTASAFWGSFGSLNLLGTTYPGYNLVVIGLGLLSAVLLWFITYRTKFGVILRATSQNRRMADALGVNVSRMYVLAFAFGCLMAGAAGAIVVPIQGAVLGMGIDALVLSFVVVVIGGLGSLEGALVGALIVGIVRTIAIQFFPELELAVLYLIGAAVLIARPTGLLGKAA